MAQAHRIAIVAHQKLRRFKQQSDLRSVHIVGVLHNLGQALQRVARHQISAVARTLHYDFRDSAELIAHFGENGHAKRFKPARRIG